MELSLILLIIGFVLMVLAADYFVDAAVSLANNLKIPTAIIGLTVVAFGTNAPELAIGFFSALNNNHDLIFGNVIGSNIINILLITGLAIIINPFRVKMDTIKREIPILLLITVGTTIMFLDDFFDSAPINQISRGDGVLLLLMFGVFVYYLIHLFRKRNKNNDKYETPKYSKKYSIFLIIICLITIIISGSLIVDNSVLLARQLGVSEKLITMTIIVFGTSLPEILISINAARKKETEFLVANIIGTNIFNMCIVLGLPAIMMGSLTSTSFNLIDLLFCNLAVLLLMNFSYSNKKLEKKEGIILLITFIVYYSYIFFV